jgi:hypothetical protein
MRLSSPERSIVTSRRITHVEASIGQLLHFVSDLVTTNTTRTMCNIFCHFVSSRPPIFYHLYDNF